MDNAKALRADSWAGDEFYEWVKKKCGSNELRHATLAHGKKHNLLGMILDFMRKHHTFKYYQEAMAEQFPEKN